MKTQLVNLKGGAKLLFNRQSEINGINVEFIFKAGSLNDPMGKLGVAHFCEHALCSFSNAKMTKKERDSYARKFQYRNAYTSSFNMGFVVKTVDEDFEDAIDYVTESFKTIKFSQEDFEEEKKIITDEIKMQLQINNRILPYISYTKVIDDPAFNNLVTSPAGNLETFSKITMEDLKEYIKKYISLNNLIITVCGNIKKSKAISIIKKYVEDRLSVSEHVGFQKREVDFTPANVHFAKAIEKGKATIEVSYDLKKIPFSYEISNEKVVSTILQSVLSEKTFEFFRTENNLCYGCRHYLGVEFGHLLDEVTVNCQEENIGKVIEKFGEFISTFDGELSRELFDKHKKKVVDGHNFDMAGIALIASGMYSAYYNYNSLYNDKYNNDWHKKLMGVTYEEANEMYKMLFKTKPHIILVASEKYQKFSYDEIVTTKQELELKAN